MTKSLDHDQITEILSQTKGFQAVPVSDLRQLVETVKVRHFDDGEFIIRKGENSNSIFIVNQGLVHVPVYDDKGDIRFQVTLGKGSIVGEIAMLTGNPRIADVIASGQTEMFEFHRDDMDPLLHEHPKLAHFLTEIVAERMKDEQDLQFVGNYRLGRSIGNGSTAKVFEATHLKFHRLAAVKMLSHSLAYDTAFTKRFSEEALLISQLSHPNIVQVYDLHEAFGTQFIIMELAAGGTLGETLHREETLSEEYIRPALRQVALALAHAHENNIVHRDVKPANITICDKGAVKLMDFGISSKFSDDSSAPKRMEGTPAFMAPEIIAKKHSDGRADIYSLGATAFTMLTGRKPYPFPTVQEVLQAHVNDPIPDPRELGANLSGNMLAFIQGAMTKDPDQRLTDWNRILELLDEPQPAQTDALAAPSKSKGRRSDDRRANTRRQQQVPVEVEHRKTDEDRRLFDKRTGVDRRTK